jgi:hypothetical protein
MEATSSGMLQAWLLILGLVGFALLQLWSGGYEVDVALIEDGATDEGSLLECIPSPAIA